MNFTDTQEFMNMRSCFEKIYSEYRLDREDGTVKEVFYQDGVINNLFIAFMHGYQFGRITYLNQ